MKYRCGVVLRLTPGETFKSPCHFLLHVTFVAQEEQMSLDLCHILHPMVRKLCLAGA